MKKLYSVILLIAVCSYVNAQNLLDANMRHGRTSIDAEFEVNALYDQIESSLVLFADPNEMDVRKDYKKISKARDSIKNHMVQISLLPEYNFKNLIDSLNDLTTKFNAQDILIANIENGVYSGDIKSLNDAMSNAIKMNGDLQAKVEKVFFELKEDLNPSTSTEGAATIPEIDFISGSLAPTAKFIAESRRAQNGQVKGGLFTGNSLNDSTNPEALYNDGSSNYGIGIDGFFCNGQNSKIALNYHCSLTGKSMNIDTIKEPLNFNYLSAGFSLEYAFENYFGVFAGFNSARPLDNIDEVRSRMRFQANEDSSSNVGLPSLAQTYFNLGVNIQANLEPSKDDSSLGINVNHIFVNDDLRETLGWNDGNSLLQIKISLIKKISN